LLLGSSEDEYAGNFFGHVPDFLAEVPVESFIIETDISYCDFVSYLKGDFDFIEDGRVSEGSEGRYKSDEVIEPEIVMYKSLRVIIKSR
jgi:hypothetical protein